MSVKADLKKALAETELGSGLFVNEATLDAAAEQMAQHVRDAKAKALHDMAWQWPPSVGPQEAREYLLGISEKVQAGTWWEE